MKTQLLIKELQRTFEVFNHHLFSDTLQMPVFIFMPKKKVGVRYIADTNQMVLGGDLGLLDVQGLLVSLLHEMVHMRNHALGVVDCRSNQYHNKDFMLAAVAVGLVCVRHRNQGWVTSLAVPHGHEAQTPTAEAIDRRASAFEAAHFDRDVLKQVKIQLTQLNCRSRQAIYCLKYECNCPPPHNSIRSGRRPDGDHPPNIRCLECNSKFKCVP